MKLPNILHRFWRALFGPVDNHAELLAEYELDQKLLDGLTMSDNLLRAHGADIRQTDLSVLILYVATEWLDDDTPLSAIRARLDSVRSSVPTVEVS